MFSFDDDTKTKIRELNSDLKQLDEIIHKLEILRYEKFEQLQDVTGLDSDSLNAWNEKNFEEVIEKINQIEEE